MNHSKETVLKTVSELFDLVKEKQHEVDELQREVKRLNLWYSNVKLQLENKEIDSAIDAKKIDELQKQLIDQGQRFNEQSQRVKDLEHKNDGLQNRVDAAKYYMKNIFSGDSEVDQCHWGDLLDILDGKIVRELEQALKVGES